MATGEVAHSSSAYEAHQMDGLVNDVRDISLDINGGGGGGGGGGRGGATEGTKAAAGNRARLERQESTTNRPFRVLVAIDGCQWSTYAFDWYLKNVHQPDNEVICYHTMDKPAVHGDEYCVSVEAFDAVMKGCESNARDLHDEYTKKMADHKVNGRVVVQFSVIGEGEAIVEAALMEKVQMVVVGTRGKGTVRRKLMGSVSDYVTRHAHCPVIVCCYERPRRRSSRLSSSGSVDEGP